MKAKTKQQIVGIKEMAEKPDYDGSTPLKSQLQEIVSDKILEGMFASHAYFETYDSCKSIEVAKANSSRLLTNANFIKRLEYKRAKLAEKEGITQQILVQELKKVALSNIQDYLGENNDIKDISQLPRAAAAAIESIQTDIRHDSGDSKGYTEKVKFKLYSKLQAIEQLGKHLGLFEADNTQRRQVFNLILGRPERKSVESKEI